MKYVGVMQIVDSLHSGGKEQMAVNLGNLLSNLYRSYLCTTRSDGPLEHQLGQNVERLRLGRKRRFELSALRRLVAFIRENQIDILHAHGYSLFIAAMASLFPPHPAVIWHDNEGNYEQAGRFRWLYRLGTTRVSAVIAACEPLAEWARSRLHIPAERVWYIPNIGRIAESHEESPALPGTVGSRIVCVANLRPQKDHITLLRAMALVVQQDPRAHLLLVGAARGLDLGYLEHIRREISQQRLDKNVSLLGDRQDVHAILQGCSIGVLSSASEALPLALLEYGMAGLPAVTTTVGQCVEVLEGGSVGILVPPKSPERLAEALLSLLRSPEQCSVLGKKFQHRVQEVYGPGPVIEQICGVYDAVLQSA